MNPKVLRVNLLLILIGLLFSTCKVDAPIIDLEGSDYPEDVGKILLNNCATSGCHNDKSKDAAAGLSLTTWNHLFEGTRNGAAVIPFAPTQSTLLLFSNTYPSQGISIKPTMPLNADSLPEAAIAILRQWIEAGAPDKNGFVKFSDNPNRKKIYVTNQGCDAVYVFDAETGMPMRYIKVGHSPLNESPHSVRVSPDGQYWYVVFINGSYFQKYRTSDDSFVGEINIGFGSWNTFTITKDSKYAFAADWNATGTIVYLDLENLSVLKRYTGSGLLVNPHGTCLNQTNNFLYATAQSGNFIYKINITNPLAPDINEITLDGSPIPSTAPHIYDPHELAFSPDYTKYFVTCQFTNEVRVFKASNDSLIARISTGYFPQEMSFSLTSPYLFVTCPDDSVSFPGKRGSVAIINYQTNSLVKKVYTSWQPHGIAVDDDHGLVYVANRNANLQGPAPHHSSDCGGRNGSVSTIDLNTLQVQTKKTEVSVDPYSVAYKK